jgi:hypothetical protein
MGRRTRWAVSLAAVSCLLVAAGCGDGDGDSADDGGTGGSGSSDEGSGPGQGQVAPVANLDHWHAAYGIYVCDEFTPPLPENETPEGIHTHGDGVVHIHPFSNAASGENATFGAFLDGFGGAVTLSDDELVVGDTTFAEGDFDCGGEDVELQVARWTDVQCREDDFEVVTEGFDTLRFEEDGEGYTVAVVPEGTDIPRPESAEDLAYLGSLDSAEGPDGEPACP